MGIREKSEGWTRNGRLIGGCDPCPDVKLVKEGRKLFKKKRRSWPLGKFVSISKLELATL